MERLVSSRRGLDLRLEMSTLHTTVESVQFETPEGQNIGLINTLATYAKVNEHGFIEAPYNRVEDGLIQDEIVYLTATQEEDLVIGTSFTKVESREIVDDLIETRCNGEILLNDTKKVSLIDMIPSDGLWKLQLL